MSVCSFFFLALLHSEKCVLCCLFSLVMLYSVKEGSVTAVITNWSRQLLLGTRVLLLSCLVKCTGSDSSLSDKYSSFRLCRLFSSTFTVTYRNEKKKNTHVYVLQHNTFAWRYYSTSALLKAIRVYYVQLHR